ncbi:MAG: class I SAM-dependent methyltransferase [Candidatus Marinimicrobia bacterium]|nr:class I SAM-dependent methyltransferase [Candidatus Neomarinimicrobiota bacterium]
MTKQWYEELFENFGEKYEQESFTKGTLGEVDFIEKEIGFNKSAKILDIGCGTGRHDIELAKRGYNVTGIDLSESMLNKARANAKTAGVLINFQQADARYLHFSSGFDLVLSVCEGAFPLMETDEMNYQILQNAARALKSGGKYILTTLNGLFPLHHSTENFVNDAATSDSINKGNTFDLMTFRDISVFETTDDSGNSKTLHCSERYYVPSEITWLLKSLGFSNIGIFGCKLDAWNRNDKLTTEDFEMLIVAEKI